MRNLVSEKSRTSEQLQYMFLSALHFGKEGKVMIRSIMDGEVIATKCHKNLRKLVDTEMPGNVYVSVNDFRNESMTPYCINAMFFDLDGHKFSSRANLEQAKMNTLDALNHAVWNGKIGRWSMLNDSGRGFQLFYVLDRSIMVGAPTAKMRNFFDATYRDMMNLIEDILDEYDGTTLTVDKSVRDMQRICRMPETSNLNKHARRKCRMIEYNVHNDGTFVTYALNELAAMTGFTGEIDPEKKQRSEAARVGRKDAEKKRDTRQFLTERKTQLELIQGLRNDWEGCRQNFCFIYYNTVSQILSQVDAANALKEFNAAFRNGGIEPNQLRNIVNEVTRKGAYKFSCRHIIDTLSLSREEINKSGISISDAKKEKKEEMREFKAKRDEFVVSFICAGEKYEDIVDKMNQIFEDAGCDASISLRTVKNIAKRYNCGRYDGNVTCAAEIKSFNRSFKLSDEEKSAENDDDDSLCFKSAKNDVYRGVVSNYDTNNANQYDCDEEGDEELKYDKNGSRITLDELYVAGTNNDREYVEGYVVKDVCVNKYDKDEIIMPYTCDEDRDLYDYESNISEKQIDTYIETLSKTYYPVNNGIVTIPGINFNVTIEDDVDAGLDKFDLAPRRIIDSYAEQLLDDGYYDYAKSFLDYLIKSVDTSDSIDRMDQFMYTLYACTNKDMVHKVLQAIEYLADVYTIDPELHVAIYDLESLERSIRHNNFVPYVHGLKASAAVVLRQKMHPLTYEPKMSLSKVFAYIHEEIKLFLIERDYNNETVDDFMYYTNRVTSMLLNVSNYHMKWYQNETTRVTKEVFVDMVRKLTMGDIIDMIDKVMKYEARYGEAGSMFYISMVLKSREKHVNKHDLDEIDELMKQIMPKREYKKKEIGQLPTT